jgi:hypothetical protein
VPGNAVPQFTRVGNISSALLTAALTTSDGSGGTIATNIYVVFTADSVNGSYVEAVRIVPVASAAGTATSATVIRIYVSTITSGATATTNTFLVAEVAIPALTADQTTVGINVFDVPLGFRLPASYTILASSHIAAAANTGYRAVAFGGDY